MARTCQIQVTQKFENENGPNLERLAELLIACERESRWETHA